MHLLVLNILHPIFFRSVTAKQRYRDKIDIAVFFHFVYVLNADEILST